MCISFIELSVVHKSRATLFKNTNEECINSNQYRRQLTARSKFTEIVHQIFRQKIRLLPAHQTASAHSTFEIR